MTKAPLWHTNDLSNALAVDINQDIEVTGISIDTRTLKNGDLFVALKGEAGDGHDYIDTAFKAGAAAALVHKDIDGDHADKCVKVNDSLDGLQNLASFSRDRCDALRIGVTGSAGKTGTKEMLHIVFEAFGKTHHSIKSYNNHWGVPLTLARMPQDSKFGIFEMGMNHAGEISHLTNMVKPNIAIITSILPVHIEFFDSEESIAKAKAEIFEGLAKNGTAIINADTPHFDLLKKTATDLGVENIVAFGEDAECDAYPTDLKLSSDGTKVTAKILGEKVKFKLAIPGKHIAINALAVLSAIKIAGLDVQKAAKTLSEAEPIEGRGKRIEVTLEDGKPPLTIIDESYNANPGAMRAAFKVLEMFEPKAEGRRIAILGDMLELGPKGPAMHAELANPLLHAKTDVVFTCGPQMEALFETLPPPWQGGHEKDSLSLCDVVKHAVAPGDIVLVKGSLGSRMAYIVEALQSLNINASSQEVA